MTVFFAKRKYNFENSYLIQFKYLFVSLFGICFVFYFSYKICVVRCFLSLPFLKSIPKTYKYLLFFFFHYFLILGKDRVKIFWLNTCMPSDSLITYGILLRESKYVTIDWLKFNEDTY